MKRIITIIGLLFIIATIPMNPVLKGNVMVVSIAIGLFVVVLPIYTYIFLNIVKKYKKNYYGTLDK